MMRTARPNLFIVGAPRCGTTAWVKYLGEHPEVFFTERKEPHYFCEDFPDFRWAKSEAEYLGFFSKVRDERLVGEASVMYLYSTVAAERIASQFPDARILIFLRRQEHFLPSYHQQLLNNRDENIRDFSAAWARSGERSRRDIPRSCRAEAFLDYKAVGRFSDQVARYLAVFPREQVMVMDYDQWSDNTLDAYKRVLAFLGLDYDGRQSFPKINPAMHFRSKAVASLTQAPSPRLLGLWGLIKKLPLLGGLRPARILRSLNRAPGYQATVSDSLSREIAEHFAADNRRVSDLVGHTVLAERRG